MNYAVHYNRFRQDAHGRAVCARTTHICILLPAYRASGAGKRKIHLPVLIRTECGGNEMVFTILAGAFLAVYTIMDCAEGKVWWPLALIMAACGVLLHAILPDVYVGESLTGMIPGLVLCAIAFATGEALGYGDCMAVAACGALLGLRAAVELVFASLILSAVWAVLLVVKKKAGRKDTFPFIPFLLAAQLCLTLL